MAIKSQYECDQCSFAERLKDTVINRIREYRFWRYVSVSPEEALMLPCKTPVGHFVRSGTTCHKDSASMKYTLSELASHNMWSPCAGIAI
jgi:hypothetical protein